MGCACLNGLWGLCVVKWDSVLGFGFDRKVWDYNGNEGFEMCIKELGKSLG